MNSSPPDRSADPASSNDQRPVEAQSNTRTIGAPEPGLFDRLKRHKVIEWTLAYAAAAYTLLHGLEMLSTAQEWPHLIVRLASLVLIFGTPVVSLLAWYHGARGLRKVSGPELALLTVLLFIAGSLLWYFNRERPPAEHAATADGRAAPPVVVVPAASIAVLPFADMSERRDQEYFADGMAEEILNVLARVDGLKVASRTSSFAFKTQPNASAPKIAAELGVRHVLEGSVRKSGATVRISVQLIDTTTDAHLWSQAFDRPLSTKNLFAIQDDVAKAVVVALREKIGVKVGEAGPAPERTDSIDAYGLFLKARTLAEARRNFVEADRLLAEAVRLDPKFADAFATRSYVHLFDELYGSSLGDYETTHAQGKEFALRALSLDARNSQALASWSLAEILDHNLGDGQRPYAEIFTTLQKAIELDRTNANAISWLGVAHATVGNLDRAVSLHRQCVLMDPSSAGCRLTLAMELLQSNHRHEADQALQDSASSGFIAATPMLLVSLAELKRHDAFLYLSHEISVLQDWRKRDALYDAIRDPAGDHRQLAAELRAQLVAKKAGPTAYTLLNAIGDYSQPMTFLSVAWMDSMRPYRQSLQFKRHVRAAGVYDYWKTYGFPPKCHPTAADDFQCD